MNRILHFSIRCSVAAMLVMSMLSVQAQEINLKIGTGGTGGTYYPIGTAIAKSFSSKRAPANCNFLGGCGVKGVDAEALSTGASVQNVTDVQSGELDIGISEASVLYFAYQGINRFEGEKKPDLRILANLYPEDLHLVLAPGVDVGSVSSLTGLRVGVDKPGSGTQVAVKALLEEFGVTPDKYKPYEISSNESIGLLKKGKLDAYFYAAGTPVKGIAKLNAEIGISLYSFTEDELRRINNAVPYYIPSVIKAGVYSGIDQDVATVGVSALLFTHAKQSDDLIYKLVRSMWRDYGQDILIKAHPKGEVITLDSSLNGLEGIGVPLHSGAEKYYRRMCQFTVPRSPARYKRYPIECSG